MVQEERTVRSLLSDATEDYLVLRASQDFSKRTLANERGVLKRFLAVNGNIWCHQVTERHATRYFEDAGRTRSPRSQQLDFTVLNQFFEWMRHTRRLPLDVDPMAGRRRPKTRRRERNRVPVTDFPRLLDIAESQDPRNRAIIAVLLYTLIRDQECADLRVGDWNKDEGWLRVRITKSHTEDEMPVSSELDVELRRWLTHYASVATRPLTAHDYLLPRRQSIGLTRDGQRGWISGHKMIYVPEKNVGRVGRIAREVLDDMGFPVTDHTGQPLMEGAHTIRRSGARALFDRLAADGYDRALRLVQSMLHHSSVSITESYLGVTADRRGRDEIIRLQPMFPISDDNVVQLSV